jgi:hypothetical protein
MRGYGFPEKDAWTHSIKEPDGPRHRHNKRWLKRYTHKCARAYAKQQHDDLLRELAGIQTAEAEQ